MGFAFAGVLLFSCGTRVTADNSLSVTVTPPLFQLTIAPGESWQSVLKIVNNNTYDVTYYAQVVDMQANGEEGRSKFIPLVDESPNAALSSYALARWIQIAHDPIVVKAGESEDVPFGVTIPSQAEPGGHYAAILVGTQPGGLHATGTLLKVSSYVSSLLFVRVKGDVTENGRIREFLTSQSVYQEPKVDFTLRFENTGNIHLQPQGDITIYNMWGRERGKVLINQNSDFGNVLPQSIRRFDFSWEGESDPLDVGLYSATVTLAYGQDNKHNTTATTYFWVVPIVPITIGVCVFTLFILMLVWFIRRYIRRALMLEGRRFSVLEKGDQSADTLPQPSSAPATIELLMEPLREGVIDLRNLATLGVSGGVTEKSQNMDENSLTTLQFIAKYRLFMLFLLVLFAGIVGAWAYFGSVFVSSRHFQITDVHIQAEPAR